jgi:Fe-S-cluster containining protein
MHKAHKIKNIKRKAYAGVKGAKRKQFCDEYKRLLPQLYSDLYNRCKDTLHEGEQISCKKGCFYCCYQHVSVNLAHGIVIVDYLYSHDEALNHFLNNYSQWEKSVGNISEEIDAEFSLAIQMKNPNAILKLAHSPLSLDYFDIQASCPFLSESLCSIYEVRPLNCAGHYSTSPCEWCSKNRMEEPKIMEVIPTAMDLMKLSTLPNATPYLFLLQITMPIMVYELLVEGLPAFLNKLGINNIFT